MTKRINRILTVLVFSVFVAAGWSILGHTAWAASRDYLSAGLRFETPADPIIALGGFVLVAIAVTRLVESLWARIAPKPARVPQRVPARAAARPVMPDAA